MAETTPERQTVVVGVDGSPESVTALAWARRYAEVMNANVRAILAWRYPSTFEPESVAPPPESVTREIEDRMRDDLASAVRQVYQGGAHMRLETIVTYGHPAEVLLGESKNADLLVVGHRGHGAFTGMQLGSVSTYCASCAACPVVVVRA